MKKSWTVLFIVHAIDNKEDFQKYAKQLRNIVTTEPLKHLDNIHLLYLENTYIGPENTPNRPIEARLYERNNTGVEDEGVLVEKKNFGPINIGNGQTLGDCLKFVNDEYLSDQFLLITWDHGAGFGIWEAEPVVVEMKNKFINKLRELSHNKMGDELKENQLWDDFIKRVSENKANTGHGEKSSSLVVVSNNTLSAIKTAPIAGQNFFSKMSESLALFHKADANEAEPAEPIKTDMLTNDELAKSIKLGFGERKIDVLIMMNCLMQMFETGYALRDTVKYLVGSESAYWVYGFHYKKILQLVTTMDNTDPDKNSREIALLCVDTAKERFKDEDKEAAFKDICVSCSDLLHAEDICQSIDSFVKKFDTDTDISKKYKALYDAREQLIDFSTPIKRENSFGLNAIDLIAFFYNLQEILPDFKTDFNELRSLILEKKYILKKNMGDDYKPTEAEGVDLANGVSIFLPNRGPAVNSKQYKTFYTENAPHECSFSQKSSWRGFLRDYLAYRNNL